MVKVVQIKDKQGKPSLHELVNRLDGMFENLIYRGEDSVNVLLASISYCIFKLNDELDDQEIIKTIDEVLSQYISKKTKK